MTNITTRLTRTTAQSYLRSLAYIHNAAGASFRIDDLCQQCHAVAAALGWWTAPDGTAAVLNFGERIALMHSELSEALEGDRKGLASDHIPGFSMVEEEFADTLIRIFDTAGAMGLRLGEAFAAKMVFNQQRPDHKPEAREQSGGKKY
jgi:NTP pyrophosphatase (non-canonical NTP hydrolase)